MHDDDHKKIGSAMYLNKSNGQYIPFRVSIDGANCTLIQPMLDKIDQEIWYKDIDNSTYWCYYKYLECRDDNMIYLSDDFQKYMIDLNDPQLDQNGKKVLLLSN